MVNSFYNANFSRLPLYNQNIYNQSTAGIKPIAPFNTANNCKLRVSGRGSIMAAPDKAIAVLGVITENLQLEIAQKENAEKISSVINAIMRLGVPKEDIQTQTYNIQPMYDYIEGKQVFRGYRVTHNLKVSIKNISRVGEIVDSAVKAGANSVSGIEFTVADPSKYYKEALDAAINDAISKAQTIGRKLRVYVSPVPVQIVEEAFQQGTPTPYLMQTTAQTTPIQPGQIEIIAVIEAIFNYTCSTIPGAI